MIVKSGLQIVVKHMYLQDCFTYSENWKDVFVNVLVKIKSRMTICKICDFEYVWYAHTWFAQVRFSYEGTMDVQMSKCMRLLLRIALITVKKQIGGRELWKTTILRKIHDRFFNFRINDLSFQKEKPVSDRINARQKPDHS